MKIGRIYILIMLGILAATFASCRQEICYDHYPAMDIRFSWELEWERDYGMNHIANWNPAANSYAYDELRPSTPEWVKMIRYFDDGRRTERFFNQEGARFEVEQGQGCSILFYNGDTEYIILSDIASLNDVRASATTRTRSGPALQALQEMYQHSRTTNPPDVIYSAYVEDVPGVMSHEVHYLPVKMQPLVYTYIVMFEFEHGFENVVLARGALGGMAEGVYLRTGVTTDETSIILFDCDILPDGCRSQVRSFGIPGFPDSYFGRASGVSGGPFTLNLEVKLSNGRNVDFNFDITDQMKKQPRGGIIRIKGLRIEDEVSKPPVGSSGFQVDVSDWGDHTEEIDLPITTFETK
ncbi:MAG: DUF5119 domain-containing protein [Muribaculaceae bacterium]|nr:DUF5119 domain-containing protein [Muribaculaceae bacterium]